MKSTQQQLGFSRERPTHRTSHFAHRTSSGSPRFGWTPDQIKLAAMIAKAVGWDDDTRQLVLRQLDGHAVHGGRITSTSPKLTNSDFEQYAAVAETSVGGELVIRKSNGEVYRQWPAGHFAAKVADQLTRMRGYALSVAKQLEATGNLNPDGAGLRGWIYSRITQKTTDDIERLDWHQLNALIRSLKHFAHQCGVAVPD